MIGRAEGVAAAAVRFVSAAFAAVFAAAAAVSSACRVRPATTPPSSAAVAARASVYMIADLLFARLDTRQPACGLRRASLQQAAELPRLERAVLTRAAGRANPCVVDLDLLSRRHGASPAARLSLDSQPFVEELARDLPVATRATAVHGGVACGVIRTRWKVQTAGS